MLADFPSIEALIFDLDGTLVDREAGATHWLASHYRTLPAPRADFAAFHAHFRELDARGATSKLETFGELARSWSWNQTPTEIWAEYRRNVANFCNLFPDAMPTLIALRARGFGLAILTNGTVECQQSKIEALKLNEVMDAVLISEREGCKKPAPQLFWRACEKLGKKPEQCLMIGDNLQADVEGALNAGLQAVFLQRDSVAASISKAPTIYSLSDLVSLLK